MLSGHKLGTSPSCLDLSGTRRGASRSSVGTRAHLPGMREHISHDDGLETVLPLSELAARLGVSAQTIYDLRSQGRGPAGFRIGKELRFRSSEIEAWLRRMEDDDRKRHAETEP